MYNSLATVQEVTVEDYMSWTTDEKLSFAAAHYDDWKAILSQMSIILSTANN